MRCKRKTLIIVQSLKCAGCADTIVSKLSGLETKFNFKGNVVAATVSFNTEKVNDVFLAKNILKALG